MAYVLLGLGALSLAYGILMAALYPAGGFFLVWIAIGAALVAAGWAVLTGRWDCLGTWVRRAICGAAVTVLLAVTGVCALVGTTAAARPPAGLDVIVVLGAGLRPDGTPTETLRYRLDAALAYLEENPNTTCIVSGGQGFGETRPEAEAMEEYLVENGLAESRVTKETRSTTTAENMSNSSELLAPGATVAVVTNDFHLYRALRIAEKNGLPGAHGLAAQTNPLYLPQAMLRECFSIAKNILTGDM